MTTELINIERKVLRDEEFIFGDPRDFFQESEDDYAFVALGDVIKQLSFRLNR